MRPACFLLAPCDPSAPEYVAVIVKRSTKHANGQAEQVGFEHAILATGSVPAIPPMLQIDDPRMMDSTAALDLPDICKSPLVVGGYTGLELRTRLRATLGSAVTSVEMTPGLLPGR